MDVQFIKSQVAEGARLLREGPRAITLLKWLGSGGLRLNPAHAALDISNTLGADLARHGHMIAATKKSSEELLALTGQTGQTMQDASTTFGNIATNYHEVHGAMGLLEGAQHNVGAVGEHVSTMLGALDGMEAARRAYLDHLEVYTAARAEAYTEAEVAAHLSSTAIAAADRYGSQLG